jgi:hypothetical protein
MADVAKDAISRLRRHTAEARKIAKWYEENPGELYLADDCSALRGRDLSSWDVARVIGLRNPQASRAWLRKSGIEPVPWRRSPSAAEGCNPSERARKYYRFADVERAIIDLLPRGFPILDERTKLRYSEALLLARRHEFATGRCDVWRCMITPVTYAHIQSGFHGTSEVQTVFERLGLSTPDHPVVLRTHEPRHYLNTLAQLGGMSDAETAAWSGRTDLRQNQAYDHRSHEEILEQQRQKRRNLAPIDGAKVKINAPVTRSEIAGRNAHGHATDIGFCEHDFSAAPCSMFMQCLHCTSHVCVKGHDPLHTQRIARALVFARQSLAEAENALCAEYDGAAEWVRTHTETIQRLEQLHAILNDPAVPNGTTIRLAKSGHYTVIEQAVRDHEMASGIKLLPTDRTMSFPGVRKPEPHA